MGFNRQVLRVKPLADRESKFAIEDIAISATDDVLEYKQDYAKIEKIADAIIAAKENGKSVIVSYGAHLVKNGLAPLMRWLVEQGYVTHLATNGAGSIHDWEYAFQGRSEEDVRKYAQEGQFGIWDETGKFINLALLAAAARGEGYGEAVGRLIHTERIFVPRSEDLRAQIDQRLQNGKPVTGVMALYDAIVKYGLPAGEYKIAHPFKHLTLQNAAFTKGVPLTVHPGYGYDIIYTHPLCNGAAIGLTSDADFLKYVKSVSNLEGGVFLNIGTSVMGPMVFEKSISMARNFAHQEGRRITDFMLVVNDIQKGEWEWGTGKEPTKDDPAYYLRFCKTFDRMGAREMHYICEDNKVFLTNLVRCIKKKTRSPKIIDVEDVSRIRQGKTLVTTNGTFDLMHVAHLRVLQEAKKRGDVFLVMVNSDKSVKMNKGPNRPINPTDERMEMLAGLDCVDYVLSFDEKEALDVLSKVRPDVHVKGGTYIAERIKTEVDLVESFGGKHICLGQIGNYSSTNIMKKIKETQ